ncbi:hypothetical protein [Capillimicrobium parvum]|uniref:hypothetical protein n=1 Tax=Capillimicrobium parvum TaxID=2884022 RepID=UPI00216B229E|nr:hypothetical protein [Capillimicrobium parvum]
MASLSSAVWVVKRAFLIRGRRRATWQSVAFASALLGAATGLRSQLGVASVMVLEEPGLPRVFRHRWNRRLTVAAAAGELVADKLASTPSRLEPPAFTSRLVLGALAAALHARTRNAPWVHAAAIGAGVAAVSARLGHDVRAGFDKHVPDPVVAVAEDGVAIGLAVAGATR